MQMNVGELIRELQKYHPDTLVLHADVDFANVKVTKVERVCVNDDGDRYLSEVFDPEVPADEDENRVWMVKII